MGVVKALLRFVTYVFQALFCLGLLALSVLAFVAGADSLHLGMLPWTGTTLLYILFFGSLAGLLLLALALRGSLRWLFFLWCLAIAVMVAKFYFLSGYRFASGELDTALFMLIGSVVSVLGSWFVMTRRPAR